ncbi:MAG: hypothetical protein DRZ76_02890, partial [Candidatus Nealsonbacteria bacterium]
ILGVGDTHETSVEFECKPWKAPKANEEQCELCNNDPNGLPCNEYRCRSLGEGCQIMEKSELYESEIDVCYYAGQGDNTPPKISPKEIQNGYKFDNEQENEYVEIRTDNGGCIQQHSQLNFTLKTTEGGKPEYAICAYNWESVAPNPEDNYASVPEGTPFNGQKLFATTHKFEGTLPGIEDAENVQGNPGERTGDVNMYVRCRDYGNDGNGNFNPTEYVINFCITDAPDTTIAEIREYSPEDGSYLAYGVNKSSLTIKLNEPANCRWSLGTDASYEEMTDFLSCEDSYGSPQIDWKCLTELTGLTQSQNNIYIKCNDTSGNINSRGFLYTLYATQNPLQITSTSPQGTIKKGGFPIEVTLQATTSGGAYNGRANCRYEFNTPSEFSGMGDAFTTTSSTTHEYELTQLYLSGDYNLSIICEDDAGNKATKDAIFNLQIDDKSPKIARVYKSGGFLKVITNEQARCYYHPSRCNFDLDDENANSMTTVFSTEHTADWIAGIEYHIKCEDMFGNINPGCAIIVSPS